MPPINIDSDAYPSGFYFKTSKFGSVNLAYHKVSMGAENA
jgi:hypothetical protein